MIYFPNAKINIGLNITEKRPDGFHNIETVFYPIGLSDILEVNISDNEIKFENTGLTVENKQPESNLCYKAFKVLDSNYDLKAVNIHLHKIIPFGAGLGGGSADASFTLRALNSMMQLHLDNSALIKYAEQIGSDCPFFILNKPAFAKEKGNNLNEIDLSLMNYFLVLIHPGIHVSTAQAYSKLTPKKAEISLKEIINTPIQEWKGLIKNDFESSVFKDHPEIGNIKDELYNQGAIYSSMSGSGSAVYGIFKNPIDLKNKFPNYFVWTETL